MPPKSLTIVIPAYNSSGFILRSLNGLTQYLGTAFPEGRDVDLIVVDDGSSDNTAEIVEKSGLKNLRLIRHRQNLGKGAAVRTGMLQASGDYRIFIDADMPFDLSVLPTILDYLDRKEFHVVAGQRSPDAANLRQYPLSRRLASWVFTVLVGRIIVTGVRDTQCGIKGFQAGAADALFGALQTNGFAFDVEILYRAFKLDMDIKRLPVTVRAEGPSTVSTFRHGPMMLWTVLLLPFRYHLSRLLAPDRPQGTPD